MKQLNHQEVLTRRYLLGQLDDEETQRLEELIFTDSGFLENVLISEDELIEDFVFQVLPAEDKESFISHFLSTPARIEKLQMVKALKHYSDVIRAPAKVESQSFFSFLKRPRLAWGFSLAASALIAVFIIGVYLTGTSSSLEAEIARLNSIQSETELRKDYVVDLLAVRTRSGTDQPPVVVPTNAGVVQMRLPVELNETRNYQAELIREPAASLFKVNNIPEKDSGSGKILVIRVPARVLVPGEYRLILTGAAADGKVENLGAFVFRVVDQTAHT